MTSFEKMSSLYAIFKFNHLSIWIRCQYRFYKTLTLNLLNSSWGVRKLATNSGFYQPLSVSGFSGAGQPIFNFDPSTKSTFTASPDLISRWQMQFGLRYIF